MNRLLPILLLVSSAAFAQGAGLINTQNLAPTGSATENSCVTLDVRNQGAVSVQTSGTYTGALSAQVTTDGVSWVTLGASTTFTRVSTGAATATITSGEQDAYSLSGATGFAKARVCGLSAMTGTVFVSLQASTSGGSSSGGGSGGAVTNAGVFAVQPAGSVAHDGAASSVNPVLVGCYASAAAPTNVSADVDAVRVWCLRNGAQVIQTTYAGVLAATGTGAVDSGTPRVTIASDGTWATLTGAVTETAPATDTASSGLNGRLQRIAQNLTTLNTNITAPNTDLTNVQTPVAPATATATKGNLAGLQYNSTPPTFTNGQQGSAQADANGNLKVNVAAGSTTAPSDASRVPVSLKDGVQVTGTISAAIPASTVTISNASPGVVTWTSHGRSANDALLLTTSGTLPAPLVAGNTVYVKTVLDANTFTVSLTPGGTAIDTTSAGSGTHTATASVLFTQDLSGYTALNATSAPWASATVVMEHSDDYTYWFSTLCNMNSSANFGTAGQSTPTISTSISTFCSKRGKYMRARVTSYGSGTNTITGTLSNSPPNLVGVYAAGQMSIYGGTGDGGSSVQAPVQVACNTNTANRTALATGKNAYVVCDTLGHLVVRLNSIPEAEWTYAAASGGISNTTTAVTIAAAAAAGIRNYVTSCQVSSDALGAATELAIRDGAGGTVLWRLKIGTAGILSYQINFNTPLKGTAATLLEAVTLTASVTGGVFINCQGYTAP